MFGADGGVPALLLAGEDLGLGRRVLLVGQRALRMQVGERGEPGVTSVAAGGAAAAARRARRAARHDSHQLVIRARVSATSVEPAASGNSASVCRPRELDPGRAERGEEQRRRAAA